MTGISEKTRDERLGVRGRFSVPTLLRLAREAAGLTRQEIASRTKIPDRYLAICEDKMPYEYPDDVYMKIYLKAYSKFLGLDASEISDLYLSERKQIHMPKNISTRRHPMASIPASHFIGTPKIIRTAIVGLAVFGLLSYFGLQLKKIFTPPDITLRTPQEGMVTTETNVSVEGVTEPEVALRINGKDLSPDDTGKFRDTLKLQEGLNVIKITARKKHSQPTVMTRRILVEPKEALETPVLPISEQLNP